MVTNNGQEKVAYRREADQSFWDEFFSWLSCGLSMLLGYQREITFSCLCRMKQLYGETPEERAQGQRWLEFVNGLWFNKKSPNHCAQALRNHITTWTRLFNMTKNHKDPEDEDQDPTIPARDTMETGTT